MITPETPDRLYSTRMRTALVLTGSGTAGAYHAGVLRALHEAGIKIDLVAGRGIGAAAAAFAAIDGGARLWEPEGVWKGGGRGFYRWRLALRLAGWAVVAGVCVLAVPFALLAAAVLDGIAGLLLTLIGLDGAGAAVTGAYGRWIETLFSPSFLPTVIHGQALLRIAVSGTEPEPLPGTVCRSGRSGSLPRVCL